MLSEDAVCLARNSLFTLILKTFKVILIGKHARRQGASLLRLLLKFLPNPVDSTSTGNEGILPGVAVACEMGVGTPAHKGRKNNLMISQPKNLRSLPLVKRQNSSPLNTQVSDVYRWSTNIDTRLVLKINSSFKRMYLCWPANNAAEIEI